MIHDVVSFVMLFQIKFSFLLFFDNCIIMFLFYLFLYLIIILYLDVIWYFRFFSIKVKKINVWIIFCK